MSDPLWQLSLEGSFEALSSLTLFLEETALAVSLEEKSPVVWEIKALYEDDPLFVKEELQRQGFHPQATPLPERDWLAENRKLFQTHYTPNVLSIFVLHKLTQFLPNLTEIHAQTMEKSTRLAEFWDTQKGLDFLIKNPALRLPTVLALKGNPTDIQNIKNICHQNQIELGNGYGEWKENTVRIANFPSHTSADFDQLFNTLRHGL